MHKTKIGEFKFLLVIVYEDETAGFNYLFADQESEVQKWLDDEALKNLKKIGNIITTKDLNYLLNPMVKNKGNRIGKALYEIYISQYPDTDQKTRVIDFWNK